MAGKLAALKQYPPLKSASPAIIVHYAMAAKEKYSDLCEMSNKCSVSQQQSKLCLSAKHESACFWRNSYNLLANEALVGSFFAVLSCRYKKVPYKKHMAESL